MLKLLFSLLHSLSLPLSLPPSLSLSLSLSLSPFLSPSLSLSLSLSLSPSLSLSAHTTPSSFDHLCEASNVAGFDATIRSAPVPEAKLITVGENPMIALYKITKVTTWAL